MTDVLDPTDDRCGACGSHLDADGHEPGCGNDTKPASNLLAAAEIIEAQALDLANDYDPTGAELADLDSALYSLKMAADAIKDVRDRLEDAIGDAMGDRRVTVNGHTLERHRRTDRKSWDTEALRFAVADSRVVDPETGEVTDELPVDKILAVWNLGAPRITALRARGIDADEFCTVEHRPGWTLKVV